jgi:hypothetical protein
MEIINVTDEIIEINVTEAVVNIVTQNGAYPLPSNVFSVFGRVGNVVGQAGDYTTSIVAEGTNLYYTNARSRAAISETITGINYDNTSGIFSMASGYSIATDASQANWDAAYNDKINSASVSGTTTKVLTLNQQDGGTITASWTDDNTDAVTSVFGRTGAVIAENGDYTTSQVTEGTNLYFTNTRVHDAISANAPLSEVSGVVSISQAGASTNGFLSSTDWNTFNGKENFLASGTTAQYYRGDKTFQTLDTLAVPENTNLYYTQARFDTAFGNKSTTNLTEGTNLYYTDARARAAITGTAPIDVSGGVVSISQASGASNGYLSSTDWTTFNNKQAALNGTGFVKISGTTISYDNNTYLTTISGIAAGGELSGTYANPSLVNSAVTGKILTGLNLTGGGTIADTDSILGAFGKVQNQISALVGGVMYEGTWNASTNTPTIVSSVGSKGDYYIVSTAGSTNINGITSWNIGDWIIFNGSTWDKVDNTDAVSSVNGYTGAVSLVTSDVLESGSLYFTNARAIGSTLTGYTSGSGVVAATDTILQAIQKLNGNVSGLVTGVSSVFGRTGAVSATSGDYNTSQVTENTNLYYTEARVSANTDVAANTAARHAAVTIGTANGLSLSTQALSLALASGSATGALSSTDWNTFNNKLSTATAASTYVPYTGATANVNLGTNSLTAGVGSFASSGGDPTFSINHSSGSGIALNITKGGNGEGLYINKTSGSGNAATIIGTLNATTLVKSGGTSSQYLMADGSVSTLTNPVTGTGTTNTLPKFTGASTIGDSNITDSGSLITLGSNSLINNGSLQVSQNDRANGALLTLTNSFSGSGWIAGDIIGSLEFYSSDSSLAGTRGAIRSISESGSTYSIKTGLSFETFSSTISQKMYLSGDGALGIGTTSLTGHTLRLGANLTGATTSYGIYQGGIIQSGVTTQANYNATVATTANATFTLSSLVHYNANQGTFGAGSTVTNQYGFAVASNLTGATNNYGFFGNIASGTNRWNLYMNGTASNYMAGKLLIGSTTDSGELLQINGTSKFTGALSGTSATFSSSVTATQFAAGSASATYPFNSISAAGTQALLNSTRTGGGGIILQNNSADSVYLGTANWAGVSGFGTSATDICLAAASNSSAIVFVTGTSLTERMRITSGGYLKSSPNGSYYSSTGTFSEFCNNTTDTPALFLSQTNTSFTDNVLFLEGYRNTTNNTWYLISGYNRTAGAYIFRVADSGNVTNTNNSYGAISDIKLKENIVDASPKLNDLLKVKIKNFNYIGSEEKQLGVIAQELEEVFPGMIEQHEDYEEIEVTDEKGNTTKEKKSLGTTTKSVKYSVFVPMLIKAIQEQQAQIEELKAKILSL